MGFTTAFIGSATLTYSIAYLTIHLHRQNRLQQAALLKQQRLLLTSLYDPAVASSPLDASFSDPDAAYRPAAPSLSDELKERWNRELESNLHKVYTHDWKAERERAERVAGNLWQKLVGSEAGQTVEQKLGQAKEAVQDGVKGLSEGAKGLARDVQGKGKEVQKDLQAGNARRKRLLEV